jgi:hypothetical protein
MNKLQRFLEMPHYRITRKEHQPYDGVSEPIRCRNCGRPITHLFEVTDTQADSVIWPLGSNCVYKITGITTILISANWAEYEAEIAADEEAWTKARKAQEWLIVNADLLASLEKLADGSKHYLPNAESMIENISKWGTLTEKQMKYAKCMVENIERYCNRTDYYEVVHLTYFLRCTLRLGRFDSQFLNDIISREQFGITVKQAEAIRKISHKYRKQISEKPAEAIQWHIVIPMV